MVWQIIVGAVFVAALIFRIWFSLTFKVIGYYTAKTKMQTINITSAIMATAAVIFILLL